MFLLIVAAMFCLCDITVAATATTVAVVVATMENIAAIVAELFAAPSMALLLSYLCHNR